jgi:hypothetical protein
MENTKFQAEGGFDLVNQDCFINIELKSYEATDKVVSLIEKYVIKKAGNTTDFSFQF